MVHRKEVEIGEKTLIIETGKMARLAHGAVWVQYEDTVVLATAVASYESSEGRGFFPLTVEFREKAYAAGKIPGGFFKREGRPSEKEILSARLIDRPIRPLFPKGFMNETQVIVSVLSSDQENDADILGTLGASAALSISDIPFEGPIASIRVGRINNEFILNPTFTQLEQSDMELVIAGSEDSILMVEGGSNEISESDMLDAIRFGHQEGIKKLIDIQHVLAGELNVTKRDVEPVEIDEALFNAVKDNTFSKIEDATRIQDKRERGQAIQEIIDTTIENLQESFPEQENRIKSIVNDYVKQDMRSMILNEKVRVDGRSTTDIRDISCEVGLIPRAHGSALFTRGETQSLSAATLGTRLDEQKVDGLSGESWKKYMLHYNFPPFCVGEARFLRGPSRREIGHGHLAERALKPMLPLDDTDFPYTIRIVSDILESNGSSSMATVCAGSLALMDAGVPIQSSIAGIAMGLIKEGDEVAILSDILGVEDHLGDMDFKIAGTRKGITAFQMDNKVKGIPYEIMEKALYQAKDGREHILDAMDTVINESRPEISKYAPRIISIKIDPASIGLVIGPGGKTIREITESSGATIEIEEDGTVRISSQDMEAVFKAKHRIENMLKDVEVDEIYEGTVKKITNFGAFVEVLPGKEGLLHISQIDHHRINRVEDVLKVGGKVKVKVLSINHDGKFDLSRKALLEKPEKTS